MAERGVGVVARGSMVLVVADTIPEASAAWMSLRMARTERSRGGDTWRAARVRTVNECRPRTIRGGSVWPTVGLLPWNETTTTLRLLVGKQLA